LLRSFANSFSNAIRSPRQSVDEPSLGKDCAEVSPATPSEQMRIPKLNRSQLTRDHFNGIFILAGVKVIPLEMQLRFWVPLMLAF